MVVVPTEVVEHLAGFSLVVWQGGPRLAQRPCVDFTCKPHFLPVSCLASPSSLCESATFICCFSVPIGARADDAEAEVEVPLCCECKHCRTQAGTLVLLQLFTTACSISYVMARSMRDFTFV